MSEISEHDFGPRYWGEKNREKRNFGEFVHGGLGEGGGQDRNTGGTSDESFISGYRGE